MNPHQKPQEDVVGLIAKLRSLMADASEQPWVYRPEEYDDWGWIRGVERDSDIGRYRPIVANAKNSDIGFDQMQPYRAAKTDPYGPNAMLIVEAVNALPVLLDAVEQAYEAGRRDMREAAGWQPIETAPAACGPDDERILVIGGPFAEPQFVLPDGDWWRMRKSQGGRTFTHWMRPLPLPTEPLGGEG